MDNGEEGPLHGLDYNVASDGTRLNRRRVEPGGTRTPTPGAPHAPGKRADGTWAAGQRRLLALPRPRGGHPAQAPAASRKSPPWRTSTSPCRTMACLTEARLMPRRWATGRCVGGRPRATRPPRRRRAASPAPFLVQTLTVHRAQRIPGHTGSPHQRL
ncbi:hypothetical protein SANTM175S_07872 [Streptomyces antimycoticus]